MPGLLLPLSAGFPVFGLLPGLLEPRWLELWDTRRPHSEQVWRVCLGHGDATHLGPRVIVTTVPRLPAMRFGEVRHAPTVADDAIGWAQQSMLHAVAPDFPADSPDRQEWWRYQLELAGWLSGNLDAEDWITVSLPVDDVELPFRVRQHGPAWAAFAETDGGWIALDGIHLGVGGLALSTVRVADYQPIGV
ncbi:hypothetical protein BCD48_03210 [Pseudofrankia sp. BMG5.36]|nr:hypothetical protein BCD48_03210 [Pseudofrankia sp. BMG5.36]